MSSCPPPKGNGLVVYGSATIHVDAGGGETAAEFDHNANFGIQVLGSGSLQVTGSGDPVVYVEANWHGLVFAQTPGPPSQSTITSLLALHNVSDGILITTGSRLKLRHSQIQSSGGGGIYIESSLCSSSSDDVTSIDLGTASDPGANQLQFLMGPQGNAGSGICLHVNALTAQTLSAAGNVFPERDCASDAGPLAHVEGQCAPGSDYGIDLGTSTISIDLGLCQ
jgi:hypothetical protein